MFVSIGQAAAIIGVSISTLRRWEKEGKFCPSFRTCGKHRRYSLSGIREKFLQESSPKTMDARQVIAYARVSSHDQKQDLERQVGALLSYCKDHKLPCQVVKDLGSGLNYNKRGLNQLIEEICLGRVSQLILTHKDRLLRFGSALLFKLCKFYNTKVVILNASQDLRFEEELANDVIEIITVFSAKLYGKRSHQNRRRAA